MSSNVEQQATHNIVSMDMTKEKQPSGTVRHTQRSYMPQSPMAPHGQPPCTLHLQVQGYSDHVACDVWQGLFCCLTLFVNALLPYTKHMLNLQLS